MPPYIIGIAGGTASGKTTICKIIEQHLLSCSCQIAVISQDSFYKNLISTEDQEKAQNGDYNFDHPNAISFDELYESLMALKNEQSAIIPVYDFKTNARKDNEHKLIRGAEVILVEGVLVLHEKRVRDLFHLKIYADADADTRLARRIIRDTVERGRSYESVLKQYLKHVKPSHEKFCEHSKIYADVIILRGVENTIAVGLIVQNIKINLQKVFDN